MLSRSSWVFFRGGVDQQRHPGLLAVRVWVIGLGGAFACHMSLFATFETGIGAAEMCSFFVGEFLQMLSLDSESTNLDRVEVSSRVMCKVSNCIGSARVSS